VVASVRSLRGESGQCELFPHAGAARAASVTMAELMEFLGAGGLERERASLQEPLVVRSLKRGETLYRSGDPFHSLFVVRSGFLKTRIAAGNGVEQVIEFPMQGGTIGIDGINADAYRSDALAVDSASVVVLRYQQLLQATRDCFAVGQLFSRIFSREINRRGAMIWLLGSASSGTRLAAFLLHLGHRFSELGYSDTTFQLRMTREEIASHLGITAETVSRNLSRFVREGLVETHGREVRIKDAAALQRVAQDPEAGAGEHDNTRSPAARNVLAPGPRGRSVRGQAMGLGS